MKKRSFIVVLGLLAVSAICYLRVSDRQGTACSIYQKHQEEFHAAAQQVLAQSSTADVALPSGVKELSLWTQDRVTVEFLCGSWGLGSGSSYWGVNYVPSGEPVGFQGGCMEHQRQEGAGVLFYEAAGDNTCYVEPLGDGWYYFEAHF